MIKKHFMVGLENCSVAMTVLGLEARYVIPCLCYVSISVPTSY